MRHRHALYLSDNLTQQLQLSAETHRVSKSAIMELALQTFLTPSNIGLPDNLRQLQQDAHTRTLARVERDLAITTEMLASLTRFFFMITPPLTQTEQPAASALGRLRFEQMIEDVSRRLRTDGSWVAQIKKGFGETEQKT
jgi:predicted transcriptional regulator